jgi:hypothetical protein
MAKERSNYHKRATDLTQQHAGMVNSHAKRVEEKNQLLARNAELERDNADLRTENAARVEELIEKEKRWKELEAENNDLMNERQRDGMEIRRLWLGIHEVSGDGERGKLTVPEGWDEDEGRGGAHQRESARSSLRSGEAEIKNGDRGEELGRERGRSSFPGADAKNDIRDKEQSRERARSSFGCDHSKNEKGRNKGRSSFRGRGSKQDKERGGDRARSTDRSPEWERERANDGAKRRSGGSGESYRSSSRRNRSRSPSTWNRYPTGIQPPVGPKGKKRN